MSKIQLKLSVSHEVQGRCHGHMSRKLPLHSRIENMQELSRISIYSNLFFKSSSVEILPCYCFGHLRCLNFHFKVLRALHSAQKLFFNDLAESVPKKTYILSVTKCEADVMGKCQENYR